MYTVSDCMWQAVYQDSFTRSIVGYDSGGCSYMVIIIFSGFVF